MEKPDYETPASVGPGGPGAGAFVGVFVASWFAVMVLLMIVQDWLHVRGTGHHGDNGIICMLTSASFPFGLVVAIAVRSGRRGRAIGLRWAVRLAVLTALAGFAWLFLFF